MKVGILSPYGALSPESGLVFVLARYLSSLGWKLEELRCNGCISNCERDSESDWNRRISQCATCESESRELASWATIDSQDISSNISTEMAKSIVSKEIFQSAEKLWNSKLADSDNSTVASIAGSLFRARFSRETPDFLNKNHQIFCKQTAIDCWQLNRAIRNFIDNSSAELFFIVGNDNLFSNSARICLTSKKWVSFAWQMNDRAVTITPSWAKEQLLCSLLLDRVGSMRSDVNTWPSELLSIMKEISALIASAPTPDKHVEKHGDKEQSKANSKEDKPSVSTALA